MYWLNWSLTGIAELSAVGLYIKYWFPNMPTWASVLIASSIVLFVNPFVTVCTRLGLTWIGTLIQVVLIIAAVSSLNSGLYSNGRVLRSLGFSKQAPAFNAEDKQARRPLGRRDLDLRGLRS